MTFKNFVLKCTAPKRIFPAKGRKWTRFACLLYENPLSPPRVQFELYLGVELTPMSKPFLGAEGREWTKRRLLPAYLHTLTQSKLSLTISYLLQFKWSFNLLVVTKILHYTVKPLSVVGIFRRLLYYFQCIQFFLWLNCEYSIWKQL